MVRATFKDIKTARTWVLWVDVLPRIGETVILDQAPKGTAHRVQNILHRIGPEQLILVGLEPIDL